MLMDAFSHLQN